MITNRRMAHRVRQGMFTGNTADWANAVTLFGDLFSL
jgi:hypothetical protein